MKPVVGVAPLFDEKRNSYWMLPGYLDLIKLAGGVPVVLPLGLEKEDVFELVDMCDGLLLTGGQDVDPSRYGAIRDPECGVCCVERDELEAMMLERALRCHRPVLGICRGFQFMNVYLGGTLHQHLPALGSIVEHQMKKPYELPAHDITVKLDTPLAAMCPGEILHVNSCHHQGIARLGEGLVAMAHSDDGLVEAAYLPTETFFMGVQWHPEYSFRHDGGDALDIARAFIRACGGSTESRY